ncbi:hypothetical protein AMJ40_01205 [candidate division TA06 bacterium DG_26]|uniref:General secretion pathway GspH domain-containing protein n=1 Tax=candidate division TA06 bacterium DG_26 TaxID=1703771 RepID=A0A0S7WLF9_UNCT6|nr:MAG: hypothetical protein AMJ40_01205 [candidate division TA06 bacterium DG_26]
MRRSNEEGFTVVQLLASLVIVAIMSAIATPWFISHQRSVQFSSALMNFKSLIQRTKALAGIEGTTFRIDVTDSVTAVVSRHSPPPENNYVLSGDTLRFPPRVRFDAPAVGEVFYLFPDGRANFTGGTLTIMMTENSQNTRVRRLALLPAIGEVVLR